MKWRNITEKEVQETVLHPEKIEDSIKGRLNAFKHINNKWIKVTYKEKDDMLIVITVLEKK